MKPVSKTAFYCCAVRAWDAESAHPILGDQYAERFLTDEARATMEPYRAERYPNAANVVRPRLIEESLRADLGRTADRRIVLLGAGFDSRAFRLPGGRWVELDEEAVLAHKEPRLPAKSSPNPLIRIPIDFASESVADRLAPFRGEAEVTVVVEGVLIYLTQGQIEQLLAALTATFPRHALLADLVTASFIAKFGKSIRARLEALGARFGELVEEPERPFRAAGYRVAGSWSLMRAVKDYGAAPIPTWALLTVLRRAIKGARVWRFEVG